MMIVGFYSEGLPEAGKLLSNHSNVSAILIFSNGSPLDGCNGGERIAAILSLDQSLVFITLSVFQWMDFSLNQYCKHYQISAEMLWPMLQGALSSSKSHSHPQCLKHFL